MGTNDEATERTRQLLYPVVEQLAFFQRRLEQVMHEETDNTDLSEVLDVWGLVLKEYARAFLLSATAFKIGLVCKGVPVRQLLEPEEFIKALDLARADVKRETGLDIYAKDANDA